MESSPKLFSSYGKIFSLAACLSSASVASGFVVPTSTFASLPLRAPHCALKSNQNEKNVILPLYSSFSNAHPENPKHVQNVGYFSFDQMKSVESRLGTLEKEAPGMLAAFYEPHLKSFSVRPGSVQVRVDYLILKYYNFFILFSTILNIISCENLMCSN